jgi:HTH-type transcriptional regulator/antitoxin MqsA
MKCPVCGAAELVPDTRDVTYSYKGESTVIPAVSGNYARHAPKSY